MFRRLALAVCAAALLLGGCSDDDGPPRRAVTTTSTTARACATEQPQPIDPGSSQHLLPGAPEPTFNTDPPTSGPHAPGQHPTGVLTAPMTKPVQVALLEGGEVIIQYRGLSASAQAALEALAAPGNRVTVAPNDALPAPIVATAWLHMQRCDRVDVDALRGFITSHAGKTDAH